MTIPILKIKVLPKATLRGKMDVRFPANVAVADFLTVAKANGTYTFGADYTILDPTPVVDPAATLIAIWDANSQSWKTGSLSALIASAVGIDQHITAAGPVSVLPNAGVVRVDQTVGAAITLNMPLSTAKTCPVLVSDWKADSGTNAISIVLTGSDKFPGNLTTWTINGDGGSVYLRPIPGVGYAL